MVSAGWLGGGSGRYRGRHHSLHRGTSGPLGEIDILGMERVGSMFTVVVLYLAQNTWLKRGYRKALLSVDHHRTQWQRAAVSLIL